MSKRTRLKCSFTPEAAQLEKIAGASSLAVGGPAEVAMVVGSGPDAADIPQPSENRVEVTAAVPKAVIQQPYKPNNGIRTSKVVFSSHAANGTSSQAIEQAAPAPMTVSSSGAGVIRPLSLTPDAQPIRLTPAQPISQPMNLGSAVGAGGGGPSSPISVESSTTGAGAAPTSAQAPGAAAGIVSPQVIAVSGASIAPAPASSTPAGNSSQPTPVHATASRIASMNSIATGLQDRPKSASDQGAAGSKLSSKGYVPTGGSGSASAAVGYTPLDGGSGTGSGSGSGSSASATATGTTSGQDTASLSGASSSTGGYTSSPDNWSITMPSGSGGSSTVNGTLSIPITPSGGSTLIGSGQSYTVETTYGSLSDITWSVSGSPKIYSGQVVPNPHSIADPNGSGAPLLTSPGAVTQFENTPFTFPSGYTPPANQPQNYMGIAFFWGEKPGNYQLKASATITIYDQNNLDDSYSTMATAVDTIHVTKPSATGVIYYANSATAKGGRLEYSSETGTGKFIPGVRWGELAPGPGQGTFQAEQLADYTTAVYTRTTSTGTKIKRFGYVNFNVKTNTKTFPPQPYTLDNDVNAITPFYNDTGDGTGTLSTASIDSPNVGLAPSYNVEMNSGYVDYVMFHPAGAGIWVPEIYFNWGVDATATRKADGGWKEFTIFRYCSNPEVNNEEWPPEWNDVQYKYLTTYLGPF